jgi:RNA polymerase sigma-70 factor (ECF subfamily)
VAASRSIITLHSEIPPTVEMSDSREPDPARVTALLEQAREGKAEALEALLPVVYDELRRVAAAYMRRERPGQTLQATALVHEAYLRLMRERHVAWQNRAHFCAIAANSMRQILVEHARARRAAKRGGDQARLTLDEAVIAAADPAVDIDALDQALERLAERDPEQARLVELRYFGGLTIEETAAVLGISPATVKRSWMVARAWLKKELDWSGRDA